MKQDIEVELRSEIGFYLYLCGLKGNRAHPTHEHVLRQHQAIEEILIRRGALKKLSIGRIPTDHEWSDGTDEKSMPNEGDLWEKILYRWGGEIIHDHRDGDSVVYLRITVPAIGKDIVYLDEWFKSNFSERQISQMVIMGSDGTPISSSLGDIRKEYEQYGKFMTDDE